MLDRPPPSTITSGSSRFTTWARPRASRSAWRARAAAACVSPASGAGREGRTHHARRAVASLASAGPATRVSRQPCLPHQQGGGGRSSGVTPGQRVVPPLAGDAVAPGDHAAVHHDAGAAAGADDDAEHGARTGPRAVGGLGQSEAVGVVLDADFPAECLCKVAVEGMAVEADRVGVLHEAGGRADDARYADADADRAELRFDGENGFRRASGRRRRSREGWAGGPAAGWRRPGRARRARSWCRRSRCPCAGVAS